ncbi:MAG: glycosyltransferase involved in cell wall biosynthesis [Hyphomicrobiaceae bacterium]|jgi:glycosyltransferase involved in cell wall biosynthesis
MRVAIGAVVGTLGGPAVYARELVRAMAAQAGGPELVVLTDGPEQFSEFAQTEYVALRSAWEQPIWDHVKVVRALARVGADLYHGTKGVVPLVGRTPAIVTIHDLAAYVMPETFSFAQRLHQRFETPLTVRRAKRIVTVSQASARDLRHHFPAASQRIEVIGNGVALRGTTPPASDIRDWRARWTRGGPVVGYLGTIQPRKNVEALVAGFLAVAGPDWTLLLAGRIRPGYRPAFLDQPDPRVRYLGVLDDDMVRLFLSSLDIMVSPSSYEGFGLTLVEAMAAGTPVIAVNASAVPEVVGDAAVLIAEPNERLIGDAIASLIADPHKRSELSAKGVRQAALHTWEGAAAAMLELYAQVGAEVAS